MYGGEQRRDTRAGFDEDDERERVGANVKVRDGLRDTVIGEAKRASYVLDEPVSRFLIGPPGRETVGDEDLARIVELLRVATGVDFSNYKKNTLRRRITRRMVLNKSENAATRKTTNAMTLGQ